MCRRISTVPPRTLAGHEDHGRSTLSEMDIETPGDDAAEQARDVAEENGENGDDREELPVEANEADAAEQVRDVGYDDDDYR